VRKSYFADESVVVIAILISISVIYMYRVYVYFTKRKIKISLYSIREGDESEMKGRMVG
jgi:hypothetical protein